MFFFENLSVIAASIYILRGKMIALQQIHVQGKGTHNFHYSARSIIRLPASGFT